MYEVIETGEKEYVPKRTTFPFTNPVIELGPNIVSSVEQVILVCTDQID